MKLKSYLIIIFLSLCPSGHVFSQLVATREHSNKCNCEIFNLKNASIDSVYFVVECFRYYEDDSCLITDVSVHFDTLNQEVVVDMAQMKKIDVERFYWSPLRPGKTKSDSIKFKNDGGKKVKVDYLVRASKPKKKKKHYKDKYVATLPAADRYFYFK